MSTPTQPKPPRVGPTDHDLPSLDGPDDVMASLGFVSVPVQPDDVWRKYYYPSGAAGVDQYEMLLPQPRMPAERMDGWHFDVYDKFLDDAAFYLGTERVSKLFHIRGMPLDQVDNMAVDNEFKELKEHNQIKDELPIFVFRDAPSDDNYLNNSIVENLDISTGVGNSKTDYNNGSTTSLVPLKDILGEPKS